MSNDLTILDATRPDGATEPVSILDNYQREAKLALKDWAAIEHDLKGRHKIAVGNTAGRPATSGVSPAVVGTLYVNTETGLLEYWDGAAWSGVSPTLTRTILGYLEGTGTFVNVLTDLAGMSTTIVVANLPPGRTALIRAIAGGVAISDATLGSSILQIEIDGVLGTAQAVANQNLGGLGVSLGTIGHVAAGLPNGSYLVKLKGYNDNAGANVTYVAFLFGEVVTGV